MLGGLIAGALGGGAQAVSGIADQVIKEAEQAKKQAYEKGLLEWKLAEGRKDAETEREFQMGKATFESQNADARLTKELDFRATEGDKDRKARERAAAIGNAPRPMSKADQAAFDINQKRTQAILNDDFEMVKKYNAILGLDKNDREKMEFKPLTGMNGETTGYVAVTADGVRNLPNIGVPASATTTPQSGGFDLVKAQREALASSGNGSPAPVRTQPTTVSPQQSYQRPPDGGNRNDVNKAYNQGIQNALNLKSQQIVAAERKGDVQAVMKLTQEYQQLQKSMK